MVFFFLVLVDFLDNRRALFAIKSAAINRDLPNVSRDKFFNYYDGHAKKASSAH